MVRPASTESACTLQPVVIAPTYNNAGTLLDVLSRIEAVGVPVIVVNDGSTDGTADALCKWLAAKHATPVWVETHPRNRGKAAALRTGFAKAEAEGFSHAVTIDTDGQLDPEQIPELLRRAGDNRHALVLGRRSDLLAGLPRANRFAWWLSALGIWLSTGRRVPDSQCGLRVYPLTLLRVIRCRTRRYGFETESVIRAAWSGAALIEVPVECHYPPKHERVSHFNVWLDGPHSFFMQAGLTIRRLIPWPHRRIASPAGSIRTSTPSLRSLGAGAAGDCPGGRYIQLQAGKGTIVLALPDADTTEMSVPFGAAHGNRIDLGSGEI
ncbi:MAG: glycosyltransferase family 2 protein, partial [Planctomycetes bacterium]|nr:glycosyltransferase family 2 protein [Planctomycetota bacterium]